MATTLLQAIQQVAPKCQQVYLSGFRDNVALFDQYGLTADKPMRQAHFAAQFLTETGGGAILRESGNYRTAKRIMEIFGVGHHSARVTPEEAETLVGKPEALFERVYGLGNPRKAAELGNTKPGDGWNFRGTGPIQSTGRADAKRWGDACGVSFEDNIELMLDPRYVMRPPLLEWTAGRLNDSADRNDLTHIRRVINGGYNGLHDAEEWFAKVWAIMKPQDAPAEAWQAATPDATTKTIQIMLNQIGYTPQLVMDGRLGPKTKEAVRWFQTLNGLKVDGIAGLVTVQTLRLRLQAFHVPGTAEAA